MSGRLPRTISEQRGNLFLIRETGVWKTEREIREDYTFAAEMLLVFFRNSEISDDYVHGEIEACSPEGTRFRIEGKWYNASRIRDEKIKKFLKTASPIWMAVGLDGDSRQVNVTYNAANHYGDKTYKLLVQDQVEYRRKVCDRLERFAEKIRYTYFRIPHGYSMQDAVDAFYGPGF